MSKQLAAYAPERMLIDSFDRAPDVWRGVLMAWLYADLGDLADHCAAWYGTLPNPYTPEPIP